MWPLPKIRNEWVSISYTPQEIICSWIRRAQQKPAPYELAAYQRIPLNNLELTSLIPHNTTLLTKSIRSFLKTHTLEHAYISCSLSGPILFEEIMDMPTASPNPSDFSSHLRTDTTYPALKKMNWDYQYLYPKDETHYSFYVCGLQRHHLFQYQLLAIAADMNMVVMTSEKLALLRLYKQIYGIAFRNSQLARDMITHDNNIAHFFTPDIIQRTLYIAPGLQHATTDGAHLSTLLGLFLVGLDTHDHD